MFTKQNVSRVAAALASLLVCGSAAAAEVSGGIITASATVSNGCEVTGAKTIAFGSLGGLSTTPVRDADTNGTFLVACTSGVNPGLYGAAQRQMNGTAGGNTGVSIPFTLWLASAGGTSLSSDSESPTAIGSYTSDGTAKSVTVFGRIAAGSTAGKIADTYTGTVAMTVTY